LGDINGDLAVDGGLDHGGRDLLVERPAGQSDDELPDNSGDRRGWGGDVYLPRLADGTQDISAPLWLLSRALQIKETAQRAQAYVKESLKWVEDDGIGKVTVPAPDFSAPGHDGDHRHHQPEDANRHSRRATPPCGT